MFYGDLALRNVLVGEDDDVLLADFGVSLDDHPRGIRAGDMLKFGSMSSAPEAEDPATVLTVRSDCWSLGVCALLVMTKTDPAALEQALGMPVRKLGAEALDERRRRIHALVSGAFDERVDEQLSLVLARMLSEHPADRPAAAEVAEQLAELTREDVICLVPRSGRGLLFLAGVALAVFMLCTEPLRPGLKGRWGTAAGMCTRARSNNWAPSRVASRPAHTPVHAS